jgi:uncharacterized membrane protein YhaH (DUF805 family)
VSPIGYWRGCYRKYASFGGRARRAEYWWYTLFNVILYAVMVTIGFLVDYLTGGQGVGPGVVIVTYLAATLLPTLAVTCRRMHDTGNSGWWQLLAVVPLASIAVFVFAVLPGNPGTNQYGPDPRTV